MRTATIKRQTKETQIEVSLNLGQQSGIQIDTGVGYFDHMLNLLAKPRPLWPGGQGNR
ncbi:MAG: hypothetical protein ACFWUH_02150 [Limosilactobacillus fermentum]|jgi:imidazoleglycerol-phosphate dehydratase